MKKILITGSTGFIGRNLKENLSEDYVVSAPDRRTLNLLDEAMVTGYLEEEKFDIVLHCANTNDFTYDSGPYEILNQNLRMFFNLEKNSHQYGKMIYFGSGAEYDALHYVPHMKESYFGTYIPKDPYGFSKYVMSRIADRHDNIYDLRLFGVYGKYEQWQRRFISNNLCKLIHGMDMSVNQDMNFDYIFIDDLCEIVKWFIECTPMYQHYNVCNNRTIKLSEIAEMIRQVTGKECGIRILKKGMKAEYSGNCDRLVAEMGEIKRTSMEEGIEKLYKYYIENWDSIDVSQL